MIRNNEYVKFLFDVVGSSFLLDDLQFREAIDALHNVNYEVRINNDTNRVYDALHLRESYYEMADHRAENMGEILAIPVTVLEVFVALAVRVGEEIISSSDGHPASAGLFESMFYNMPIHQVSMSEAMHNVRGFVRGDIDINGYGGPFPLRHIVRDQRNSELWSSMSSYLVENYNEYGEKL